MKTITGSPAQTRRLGAAVAGGLKAGDIVAFSGGFGSGKTTMIQGIVRALGGGRAFSPSFMLVNEYPGRVPVFHLDCYRLTDGRDLDTIGWSDCAAGILLVEWADRIPESAPRPTVRVRLRVMDRRRRSVEIVRPRGPRKPPAGRRRRGAR